MRRFRCARFRRPTAALGVALALLVVAASGPARALTLLPLDLAQLTGGAGRIFVGRVDRVDGGHDANGLPAVWTTFTVAEVLKGEASTHVTLKHLGTTFGGVGAPVLPHAGIPRYEPGESVVLFVHPESALGFTSPVGLGQGCFRIRERAGRRVAENDVGNRNLTAPSGAARTQTAPGGTGTPTAEPLPLDTLLGRVRALVDTPP